MIPKFNEYLKEQKSMFDFDEDDENPINRLTMEELCEYMKNKYSEEIPLRGESKENITYCSKVSNS